MGQIIGRAAKPKRCNINQLSQLGTPAAGEHILVSSDNSMNAAGQGNFDCYIVGTGNKAATALELKRIDNGSIVYGEKRAVNGDTLADDLKEEVITNVPLTWTSGGFINSSNTVTSNSSYTYIQNMDVTAYGKLVFCVDAQSSAKVVYLDNNLSVIKAFNASKNTPFTLDRTIDRNVCYISLSNIASHAAYCHSYSTDTTKTREKISAIQNSLKQVGSNIYGKGVFMDIPITIESGYVDSSGVITSTSYYHFTEVDISDYDIVMVIGSSFGSLYTAIYDENHLMLAKKQSTNKGGSVTFDIVNDYPTAKYVCGSSISNKDLALCGIKKTSKLSSILFNVPENYFLYKQKIVITQGNFFYNGNRTRNDSQTGSKSNIIRVVEGMTFYLTSNGSINTLNYITYDEELNFVSVVKGNVYTNEQITIPSGVAYIEFFSYSSALVVSCDQLEEDSVTDHIDNILYGKTYVAIGDSFTAPIGSETIESGPYQGQSKVYPYIIGNRNKMSVINQGASGSVLNGYLLNERYNNIPADVDYITIWYGINDQGHNISIGTADDQPESITSETSTTTCGGFNFFFKWLLTNRPFAHVGVIITDYTSQERRAAIIACCQKWGYPYLDLMGDPTIPMLPDGRNSEISVSSEARSLRASAFNIASGNIHPSNALHEWQSTFIEAFMRRI